MSLLTSELTACGIKFSVNQCVQTHFCLTTFPQIQVIFFPLKFSKPKEVVRSEVNDLKNEFGLGSSSSGVGGIGASASSSDRDLSVHDLEKARKEERRK